MKLQCRLLRWFWGEGVRELSTSTPLFDSSESPLFIPAPPHSHDVQDMPDRDRLAMTQWKKWVKYKRFPFKGIIHTLLTITLLVQIYFVSAQLTEATRGNRGSFSAFFFPPTDEAFDPNRPFLLSHGLYTVGRVLNAFKFAVTNYYRLNDISLNEYEYLVEEVNGTTIVERPLMHVMKYDSEVETYKLSLDHPYGPFVGNHTEIRKLLGVTTSISLSFRLLDIEYLPVLGESTFRWEIDMLYRTAGGGVIPSIDITKSLESITNYWSYKLGIIPIAVLVLTAISFTLNFKALIMAIVVYFRARRQYNQIPRESLHEYFEHTGITPKCYAFADVPLSVKLQFFLNWNLVSLIGDIFLAAYAFLTILQDTGSPTADSTRLLLGVAVFLQVVLFTRYLEYNSKFYTLILTLKVSLPNITRFSLSVAPFYLGYAIAGIVLFSPFSARFYSVDKTSVTLFALLNGDDIHDTFNDLAENYPIGWVSRLYLYTFVLLFITTILNIFIFIIENAYHVAKVLSLADSHERGADSIQGDPDALLIWQVLKKATLFDLIDIYHHGKSAHSPLLIQNSSLRRKKEKYDQERSKQQELKRRHRAHGERKKERRREERRRDRMERGRLPRSLSPTGKMRKDALERTKDQHPLAMSLPTPGIPSRAPPSPSSRPIVEEEESVVSLQSSTKSLTRLEAERDQVLARAHPSSLHALDAVRNSQSKFMEILSEAVAEAQSQFLSELEVELSQMTAVAPSDSSSDSDSDSEAEYHRGAKKSHSAHYGAI